MEKVDTRWMWIVSFFFCDDRYGIVHFKGCHSDGSFFVLSGKGYEEYGEELNQYEEYAEYDESLRDTQESRH